MARSSAGPASDPSAPARARRTGSSAASASARTRGASVSRCQSEAAARTSRHAASAASASRRSATALAIQRAPSDAAEWRRAGAGSSCNAASPSPTRSVRGVRTDRENGQAPEERRAGSALTEVGEGAVAIGHDISSRLIRGARRPAPRAHRLLRADGSLAGGEIRVDEPVVREARPARRPSGACPRGTGRRSARTPTCIDLGATPPPLDPVPDPVVGRAGSRIDGRNSVQCPARHAASCARIKRPTRRS